MGDKEELETDATVQLSPEEIKEIMENAKKVCDTPAEQKQPDTKN